MAQPKSELPFSLQVADHDIAGVRIGSDAMKAAGVQPQFVAVNHLILRGMRLTLTLRVGKPPVFNRPRSPKTGLNYTKTNNRGIMQGTITEKEIFTRLEGNMPLGHHKKDKERLRKPLKDPDHQHTVQLTVSMRDIIREIGPTGDLEFLGYDERTGELRLGYKEGRGPKEFNGQFVINLFKGESGDLFYSRPWDAPQFDPAWNEEKKIIEQPTLLDIPPEVYERVFYQHFDLKYTDDKMSPVLPEELNPVKVFANTPRTPKEFIAAMPSSHKKYHLVQHLKESEKLSELSDVLSQLEDDEILKIYDESGKIVTGDWDGMALSYPSGLKSRFTHVFNTFESDTTKQQAEMKQLLSDCKVYLRELKESAVAGIRDRKKSESRLFDDFILGLLNFDDEVGEFALSRAGCITSYEFLFQQLVNRAYRDPDCEYFGEKFDMKLIQETMDQVLVRFHEPPLPTPEVIEQFIRAKLDQKFDMHLVDDFTAYLTKHAVIALQQGGEPYKVPHPQYDPNVQELYQHGFDMRNPYGCNLGGAWLMLTADGGTIYGDTQEQLIEVMLIPGFLEQNRIDINHGADMGVGWHRVIEKQISLGQTIPEPTRASYNRYHQDKFKQGLAVVREEGGAAAAPSPSGPH